jgi:hypothetical protein
MASSCADTCRKSPCKVLWPVPIGSLLWLPPTRRVDSAGEPLPTEQGAPARTAPTAARSTWSAGSTVIPVSSSMSPRAASTVGVQKSVGPTRARPAAHRRRRHHHLGMRLPPQRRRATPRRAHHEHARHHRRAHLSRMTNCLYIASGIRHYDKIQYTEPFHPGYASPSGSRLAAWHGDGPVQVRRREPLTGKRLSGAAPAAPVSPPARSPCWPAAYGLSSHWMLAGRLPVRRNS